jgi:hypothetical protein
MTHNIAGDNNKIKKLSTNLSTRLIVCLFTYIIRNLNVEKNAPMRALGLELPKVCHFI